MLFSEYSCGVPARDEDQQAQKQRATDKCPSSLCAGAELLSGSDTVCPPATAVARGLSLVQDGNRAATVRGNPARHSYSSASPFEAVRASPRRQESQVEVRGQVEGD